MKLLTELMPTGKAGLALVLLAVTLVCCLGCKPSRKTIQRGKPIPCPVKDC